MSPGRTKHGGQTQAGKAKAEELGSHLGDSATHCGSDSAPAREKNARAQQTTPLQQGTRFLAFSLRVAFVFGTTERDSNSVSPYAASTSCDRPKESLLEEGCVRGAFGKIADLDANPVNARRRDFGRRAFCV